MLAAGAIAVAVTRYTASSPAGPAPLPHIAAKPTATETAVAREFVVTAVAREHLDRAWAIIAPELRQNMTLGEWKTGTIPVVPYPVGQARVRIDVVSSFTDVASLSVSFLPKPGASVRAATFRLGLRRVDDLWLVASWAPTSTVTPHKGK